ncbi:hypothetical protein SAMN02745945_01897 [Peptoclostridium litorale DSM 5388]|uniref:Uncharacterized protein n=1 Tax=Peptoclostridium litorale DSM 5388 TaxID=1121324 RepID=A0A069RPS6_PEPLI|nr:hypothetical protein [Peptoclostridium litorale]KDR96167.1 hypothetical protein CLIT_4c00040 [Peptoclostridium litorale DSM 5388]SIO12803.1 hypothetical protein SAMN02745945_01897 [Peptoclostridium litorale DSM 5388]
MIGKELEVLMAIDRFIEENSIRQIQPTYEKRPIYEIILTNRTFSIF